MKLGTPGFVGARLIEAREARGITAASLAEMIDVSRQAVSKYENGRGGESPSPQTFTRICEVLNFPPAFFLKPARALSTSTIYYRSMVAATKTARAKAVRRLWWLSDLANDLETFLELPVADVPDLGLPADPFDLTNEAIEAAAEELRRRWGLGEGPITNVVWLLENHGILVAKLPLAAELDGLSTWVGERPLVVLNSEVTACRSTFDAAHELAHLILHRHLDARVLSDNAKFKHIENQAHRFAGAFCFPAKSFAREVSTPTLEMFASLKRRWRVSIKMMIHRAKDLEFLPDDRAVRLYRNYNWRKWHIAEPFDNEMLHDRPRLLARSVVTLEEHGVLTKEDVVHRAGLARSDLGWLVATSPNHFEVKPVSIDMPNPTLRAQVIPLRPVKR